MRSQTQAPVVVPTPAPSRRAARAVSTFASLATLLAGLLCAWTPAPASAQAGIDGDPAPTVSATLTIADAEADEGNALAFTVRLDNAVPGGFTVTPSFTDGATVPGGDLSALTARQGSDYRAGTLALDFTGRAGEAVTFTVPTIEDYAVEYPELFTVGLAVSGTTHSVMATDTATGLIRDDDAAASAGARAGIASGGQLENKGSYWRLWSPPDPTTGRNEYYCDIAKRVVETTNRAIRSKVFQIPCKVKNGGIPAGAVVEMWSAGSATATNNTSGNWDYNFYHTRLKMYPNDYGTQRLDFRINDDQSVEGAEYFEFALKWTTKVGYPPFWFTLNESLHVLKIYIDDDDAYQLSVSPDSVSESGGAKTVTVTATNVGGAKLSEARTLSVQVGASTDHAVEGTDYQTVNNFDLTIPKGSSSATGTFTLTPVDDTHLEGGERITVAATAKTAINGHTLRPRITGTGLWLTDSETITLSATPDVNEGGGAQTVTVTATSSVTAQRAIPVTISVGKSGDAAVSGTDYEAVSDFTLTIPSGSKSGTATFRLTPINDTTQENDETLSIAGSVSRGGAVTGASVKILDNDVLLSLNPASVGEEGGAKTVTVTARAKTARTASRALTVSVGKLGDEAVSGTDYGAVADFSLTIAANAASGTATFTFTPRDDTIIEGSETITVGGTGTGVDVNSATLTLTETDTTDFVITLNPSKVAEGVNWRSLTVTISTTDGYTISQRVTCSFNNGGGSATYDTDYKLRSSANNKLEPNGSTDTIRIEPGQTSGSKTISLRTISDNTAEGDETVQIKGGTLYPNLYKSCTSSDNPRTVDSEPYPADLTITDDDGSISLSVFPSYVWENAPANVEVTATLPGNLAAPEDTLVTVSVGKSGDAAVEGTDYTAVDDFYINIPKGKKSAKHTFWFSPIDDTLVEDTETLSIDGTATKFPVSGTSLSLEDDEALNLTLSASPSSVAEDAGATTVTVTAALGAGITYVSDKTVTVRVGKTGDSAVEGTDYAEVANFNFTIPANQSSGTGTFTLTPVHDTTPESDESISLTGGAPGLTPSNTSITIEDVGVPITLAASPASVTENGGAKTVTVTATNSKGAATSDIALTIVVGKDGDAAIEGTDYTAVDDFTLTIKKDATTGTGTFTLAPVNDDLYEGTSESLTISGSATGYTVSDTSVAITDDDSASKVTVSLSVDPARVKECVGEQTVKVTAKLPETAHALPEARTITISVGKSDDDAVSGTDYTAVADFDLTIPAGQRRGLAYFDLTPTDDILEEGDEALTVSGTATRLSVKNDAEVTIEDDDQPIIILTMNPATIPENNQSTEVEVTATQWTGTDYCGLTDPVGSGAAMGAASMAAAAENMTGASAAEIARALLGPGARAMSAANDRTITVSIGDTDDTAVSGTDYTAVNDFTITIKSGQTSGQATFTTTASLDSLLEPPETLTAKGTSTGVTVTPAGGYVNDKDKTVPTLTVTPSTVAEGAGATTMTVTVTTGGVTVAEAVDISFGVTSGTATSGTDFAAVDDFDLTIAGGDTSVTGTFTLTPTEDTVVEGSETLNVNVLGTTLTAAVTITDNDSTDITLTATPDSVTEDGGKKTVTVEAATDGDTFPADTTVTVAVGKSGDGATEGTDYATVADFDVTIKAGNTKGSATFDLTPTNDAVFEGDETLSVDGTSAGLTVHGDSVTITDDDSAAVTVDDVSEDEGDSLTFTVTLDTAVQGGLRVTAAFTDVTAVAGTDYVKPGGVKGIHLMTFTGTANETKTFTVQTTEDAVVEADETFTVGLTVSNAPTGVTATDTGTGTIDNDDNATVTIANASAAEGDSLSFTATLDKAVDGGLTATLGYTDVTAVAGTDYVKPGSVGSVLTFTGTANETKTFTVQTKQDTTVEEEETFTVTPAISGLKTGVSGVTGAAGTGTINDDDGRIYLSATPSSVTEDGGAKTVTVTATSTHTYTAAKTITVTVGKDGDSAVEGTDYTTVADVTLTLPANSRSGTATFTLTPTNDTIIEDDETLSINGASGSLTVNGTSVTITDNEVDDIEIKVDVEPFLDTNPDKIAENDAAKKIKVTAGTKADANGVFPVFPLDREVNVTVGESTDSALEGTDYEDVAGFTVAIKAGQSSGSKEFTLTPKDDTLVEGDEAITVKGSASGLTVTEATITITDDDTPAMSLAVNPASVGEGAGDTTVTVTASTGGVTFKADRTVTVSVGKSGDGATSGTDYDAVTDFDVTINKGDTSHTGTFTLKPTDDTLVEGDEAITVSGTTTGYTVTGASITLEDNDVAPAVNLSVNPSSVSEGDNATEVTVTATFSNKSTYEADTTVTVSVGDSTDSATSGTDYTAVTDFKVTIKAKASKGSATFTLTPTQDTLVEGNEAITVSGTHAALTVNGTSMTLTDDDGAPAINLSVSPSSVAESADATTVTVTATFSNTSTYGADTKVTVSVGKSGTATSGTDYTAVTDFDVTIKAKASSGSATFTLTPTQDTLVEGNETITVGGTVAAGVAAVASLTVNGTSITLTDDDTPNMTLAANPSSVSEGAGDTTVKVTASTGGVTFKADRTVTVTVGKSGDSATSGTDYDAVTDFDVTITKGDTSNTGTFTLKPTDDTLVEGDEAIAVSGTTTGLTVADASITLTDDDQADLALAVNPASVAEDAGKTTVTVTASTGGATFTQNETVRVTVGREADSATSGTDYAAVAGFDVTITAGQSSGTGTFDLTPTDDDLIEGDETISVAGTSGFGAATVPMTLTDDDRDSKNLEQPPIALTASPSSVSEGGGVRTITVTATVRDGKAFPNATTVTVSVGASGDSAVKGTDYAAVADFPVTIAAEANSGSTTFKLTPTNDTLIEGNETITVSGTTTGLTVSDASITLTDNDKTPEVNLSVNPSSVSEGDNATEVTVTAMFSNTSTYLTDTTVAVSVGDGKDSATSGTDYTAVTAFNVTIAKGKSSGSATFTLTPTQDALVEGNETITVSGTHAALTVNGTSMTLTDDGAPAINLSVNPSSVAESAGDTTVTVTATFSTASTYKTDTTVTVSVGDSTDSAASGTDYTAVTAFDVTIAAKASSGSATFTLTPTQDTLVEGNETITVGGTVAAGGGLTVNPASITLTDDDTADLALAVNPASVAENAGKTTVTVTASTGGATFTQDETVRLTVGRKADSATSGTDYAAVANFTVTIAAGQTSGSAAFTLTPINDTLVEKDETITVSGTNAALTVNGTNVTLTDDDSTRISLSVSPARVAEDAGSTPVTVTATFSNSTTYASDTAVTVSVGDSSDSATLGTDYAAVANFTVTIAAGQTSGSTSFTLTPINDTLAEKDETITVSGTNAALTVDATRLTLTDDDSTRISLSVSPARVAEDAGATPATVTATFSPAVTYASDTTVTVSVGASGDSAISGTDYTAVASFTVTIAAGQTSGSAPFTLTPINDTLAEGDETISVNGTATGLTVNGTHLTLVDDDVAINLSVRPARVAEDAGATSVTLTATFSPVTTYDTDTTVTVTVGHDGDSATEGVDYQSVASFTVTIAAGRTSGSTLFTLTPIDDTLVEDDETTSVNGTADRDLTVNGTHLTLTDAASPPAAAVSDDASDDFATVTVSNARALEGDTMTFTLTLDEATTGSFTVTPVYSDDTATKGVDYTPNASPVAFAGQAGEQHTFTVATLKDKLVEPAETFGVSLRIVGPSGIRGRSGSGTIDSNDVVTVVAVIPQANDDLPTTVEEAGGARQMMVRVWANGLTFSTDMAFTVKVGNGSGTAQEGVDYQAVPDFDVIIPAGATSATRDFTLTPIDDRIVEGDETIGLDGTLPGYEVAPSTVTILDDDAPEFSLAVAPTRVRESAGPTPVTVTVKTGGVIFLTDLNVAVKVSDGTAIAGEDYDRVATFDLRIAAGKERGAGTFTLIPTADGVKEDDEDIRVAGVVRGRTADDRTTVAAGLADGYELAPESVVLADDTVLPNHLDAVNRALLPHVARAMLASNIAALAECGVSGAAPGANLVSLLGTHGEAFANGETNLEQVLGGADFRVPLRASQEEEASSRLRFNTLWGCGDYRMLSDRSDDALDWEGNLFSLHLGMDAQVLPNLVTGLALSRSQARFDYRDLSAAGQHRTDMTSVSPYVRWTLSEGASVWAMAGLGWGSVGIDDEALAAGASDAGLTLAALGLDNALLTRLHGSGETSLRLKAEGSLGRLSVDGSDGMSALAVEVQRLRLALEGSRTWQLRSGGAWTTALEVGLRHDGGDGATGSGVEVGGGVNYHDARLGLTLALSGRTLVAHGADYDEWGVGGVLRYDPGTQGVGLSASLQPILGQAQSGVAQLWEQAVSDPSALGGDAARVEAELGYGLVALGGRGLVRPYTQVSMAGEGSRHYRMGSRLELGDTLRVGVEVGRREASGSETDHGVMLRLELGSAGGGVAVGSGLHSGGVHNAGPVDGRLERFTSRAWDAGRE